VAFQAVDIGLYVFVFLEPLRFLGRLDGGVAVILELSDTLSRLFDKLKELGCRLISNFCTSVRAFGALSWQISLPTARIRSSRRVEPRYTA
jgi:hypothetical protein